MDSKSSIQLTFLQNYKSIQEAILAITPISKSQLKKQKLNKNFLNKKVRAKTSYSIPINILNYLKINPVYLGERVTVLFEDKTLIALSKPSKIHSHPQTYNENYNVLSAMSCMGLGAYLSVNTSRYDRGLLYRLDFETSGLMIYLKNQDTYDKARSEFQKLMKQKEYLAVVSGDFPHTSIKSCLSPSLDRGKRMKISATGVEVELNIEKLAFNGKYSLLKVRLGQGIRHQIRAQLCHVHFPIVGDELYGGESAQRLHLHCFRYEFDLDNKNYILEDSNYTELTKLFSFDSKL